MSKPPIKRTSPSETRRVAIALGALVFALGSPFAYVAQRVFERARSGPTDPLLVVFDLHTSFYWRASTAAWWGVVLAIGAYAFAAQPSASTLRDRLTRTLAIVALPLALALGLARWRMP